MTVCLTNAAKDTVLQTESAWFDENWDPQQKTARSFDAAHRTTDWMTYDIEGGRWTLIGEDHYRPVYYSRGRRVSMHPESWSSGNDNVTEDASFD